MPELPKYHLSEQRADAILRPLALALGDLETRAKHYLDRLYLTDEDRAAVAAAHAALESAHAEVERLWQTSAATPQRGGQEGK